MDANTGSGSAMAVPAAGKLRVEPTALPTQLFRLGSIALGWHPVIVPARAAA